MSSALLSLPDIYNSYKSWICKNPQSVGDWETSAKWISYFIAGRINNSHVVSELVYCLSNLLVMFNDRIIKNNYCLVDTNSSTEKLKLWLTIVEYSEVFCELSAKKLWGATGKWIIVVCIQVFKCISRLMLIYRYKESIIQHPPIPALDRTVVKTATNSCKTVASIAQDHFDSASFTLKSSGRVVRKIEASPPIGLRTWKPLPKLQNIPCENDQTVEEILSGRSLFAETVYVTKPLIHLASMACFGTRTWKPWLISLSLDLTSLHLYRSSKANKLNLTPQQRLHLSKRTVLLVLYLIRSPFYDRYSNDKINALLEAFSNHIPLAGLICRPLTQYLPFWQSTYFYMWST